MSNKMKKKQVQNQAQQGRSMVEMLGVLAIIGVLSIGGISGYRMAMDRYQANQIANEINLMRTEAKMKVAQGAEELLLGSPYDDEKHLKFNASYGVKVESKDIFDEETNTTETGYSFTLSNIPGGVCKPLATLLDGMDDTAALEINGKDYETAETPCDNEENEVLVAFSTKDLGVSGGEKEEACDEATCEGYCSADGACKNCPADAPWDENTKQCKCSSSKHWNKEIEECAACGDNSHCTSSSKPVCKAGVCDKCTADEECIESGKGEHCSSSGSCVTCGSSASAAAWNETARKCDTCKNVDPDTPNWSGSECVSECPEGMFLNSSQNRCVECLNNEHCEKGDEQHYWCDTSSSANYGTCTLCYSWDGDNQHCQRGECESNEDCKSKGDDYFCLSTGCNTTCTCPSGSSCGNGQKTLEESCSTYKCEKIDSYKADNNDKEDPKNPYILSSKSMNWWSAQRFCEALGNKRMVTISELDCCKTLGGTTTGYCCTKGETTCSNSTSCNVSSEIKALRRAENGSETRGNRSYWLSDPYESTTLDRDSCNAYVVTLFYGDVGGYSRSNSYFALCE